MRCMTAIWAAGAPKLRSATRVHARSASLNETPCAGTDLIFSAVDTCVMRLSCSWRLHAILAFQLESTPTVQSVVDDGAIPSSKVGRLRTCATRRRSRPLGDFASAPVTHHDGTARSQVLRVVW